MFQGLQRLKKGQKGQKGQNILFSTKGREEKKFSLPGKGKIFSFPGKGKFFSFPGKGIFFFFPVFLVLSPFLGRENFFSSRPFGLFWPFLLKRVKTPISGSKKGWEVFSGRRQKTWTRRRELPLKWKKNLFYFSAFSYWNFYLFQSWTGLPRAPQHQRP